MVSQPSPRVHNRMGVRPYAMHKLEIINIDARHTFDGKSFCRCLSRLRLDVAGDLEGIHETLLCDVMKASRTSG
jgi:hypothetical protein